MFSGWLLLKSLVICVQFIQKTININCGDTSCEPASQTCPVRLCDNMCDLNSRIFTQNTAFVTSDDFSPLSITDIDRTSVNPGPHFVECHLAARLI